MWKAILVGVAPAALVLMAACSQSQEPPFLEPAVQRAPQGTTLPEEGAEGPTLWVRTVDEGTVFMRSPTFR